MLYAVCSFACAVCNLLLSSHRPPPSSLPLFLSPPPSPLSFLLLSLHVHQQCAVYMCLCSLQYAVCNVCVASTRFEWPMRLLHYPSLPILPQMAGLLPPMGGSDAESSSGEAAPPVFVRHAGGKQHYVYLIKHYSSSIEYHYHSQQVYYNLRAARTVVHTAGNGLEFCIVKKKCPGMSAFSSRKPCGFHQAWLPLILPCGKEGK